MKLDNMVIETFVKRVAETEEDFIIETILPYCEYILEEKINKKELKEILINGQKARMRWISVDYRLPDIEKNVLFVVKSHGHIIIGEGCRQWENSWIMYRWTSTYNGDEVLAWMPMPEWSDNK